jgi:Flp pilus assembly protein TadD
LNRHREHLAICFALCIVTVVVFWRVQGYDFVVYDDRAYVADNPYVNTGLTTANATRAFMSSYNSSWVPLPIISHLVDVELYGLNAGGHHTTNLILHLINVCLLYLLLIRITGAQGRSAIVAALFAIHPMHVEPVIWISSRKDVLSMVFMLACLHAYVAHVRQGKRIYYALHLAFFALSLLSKPIMVTLPVLLLLLDFWPLARIESFKDFAKRILEKWLHGVLTVLCIVVTLMVVEASGSLRSLDESSFAARLITVPYAYLLYVAKTFWPVNLTIIYESPAAGRPLWQGLCAFLILALITYLIWRRRRALPHALMGWGWFFASLLPVVGLVSYGDHFFAERYTYLAHIGLFIFIVWEAGRWFDRLALPPKAVAVVCAVVIVLCASWSWIQVGHWRDSVSLFEHAVRVHPEIGLAQLNLGTSYARQNNHQKAVEHYEEAVRCRPRFAEAYNNLCYSLLVLGQPEKAVDYGAEAIRIVPDYTNALFNRGKALMTLRRYSEAADHFLVIQSIDPDHADGLNLLGVAQAQQGQFGDAVATFQHVTRLQPNNAQAHANLGRAHAQNGDAVNARAAYRQALMIDPSSASALKGLADLGETPTP